MNAQRMADTVVKEAQEKADAAIAEAQKKAEEILAEAQNSADNARELADQSIVREREELARVRKEVAAFKARLMAAYREHLTLIGVLEGGTGGRAGPGSSARAAPAGDGDAGSPGWLRLLYRPRKRKRCSV